VIIWFNLWLLTAGHWTLIETWETLEECQDRKVWLEQVKGGDYYCRPIQMERV